MALRSIRGTVLTATDGRDVLHNSPDGWEVEQPWLWYTGPANGGQGPWGNPIPGAEAWHQYTTIPAVDRCTGLVVDSIAALPWHVYRNDIERLTTPEWIADPQGLRLDGRLIDVTAVDDIRMSQVDFWGQWLLSALWFGDGFVYVPKRNEDGSPKPPVWVLHPADVKILDGAYWVEDYRFAPGQIIHLRGRHPIRAGRGSGALMRFGAELGMALSLRDYAAGAFQAGVPAGYLKVSAPQLTQDQADGLRAKWMSQHGRTKGSIAVLNSTTEFHPLTWSPVDLAAADFARISLGQIALIFGVPAYMLGAPSDSSTYANVESRMIELYQHTLLPWMRRIEAVLDAQLPRGTELRIEIDGLLRADTKTRYETYDIALRNGILTLDEVRALESRGPTETPEVVA
jgi:HK97 family phage portal protein